MKGELVERKPGLVKRRFKRGGLVALAVAVASSGCYRYVPAEVGATPPGTAVRMLVTAAGAEEAVTAGALNGGEPRLEGTVVEVDGLSLVVRVPVALRQQGFTENRMEQAVRVPIGEIVSYQRRELNGPATALAVGGAAVVSAALFAFIVKPLAGSGGDDGEPPDELFLDLISISIPFGR